VIRSAGAGRHGGNAPLRRLLVVGVAALVPVLAGCEAGNDAPTLNFHPATDAQTKVVGSLSIVNVFVLGAPLGSSLAAGQSASLFFGLVNTGPADRLLSITAPGTASSVKLPAGGVPVNTGQRVLLTGPQAQAYLVKLTHTLVSGTNVTLKMDFQKQGQIELQVPVFAWATHYTTLSPPPSPTTTPTAKGKHHHATSTPSPTVTPTPTATPSPSVS
jgi:copper(I)-binding protein